MKCFRGSPDTIKGAPRHDGAEAGPVGENIGSSLSRLLADRYILIAANRLLTATP
jgi:hypothetical protein